MARKTNKPLAPAGTRVWAIASIDESTVHEYGTGTYMGDHPYPGGPGWCNKGTRNPLIVLDDNKGVVYGCECWWGEIDADAITLRKTLEIVTVPSPHQSADDEGAGSPAVVFL